MTRKDKFDAIIVETTGIADPGPVAQTFFVDEDVSDRTSLDAIVAVVDARHFPLTIDSAPEAEEQIAFADVVLLNKVDLVSEEELASVTARIRRINPTAAIRETERCGVELADILGRDAFSLDRILEMEPHFLDEDHAHDHDEHVTSFSLVSDRPLDPERFFPWIREVTQTHGVDLLRMKGILAFAGDDQRFVVQGVHMLLEGDHQRPWKEGEARTSRLVFIGKDLPREEIEAGFAACAA
jgi:G3E family GTPase